MDRLEADSSVTEAELEALLGRGYAASVGLPGAATLEVVLQEGRTAPVAMLEARRRALAPVTGRCAVSRIRLQFIDRLLAGR